PNRLVIGQRICIPVPAPPTCPGFLYTIQAGDTLFALAARFGTTVQAILAANPGLDPNSLQVGRRICIPVPAPVTTAPGEGEAGGQTAAESPQE
ncbi:MAG: LysM peptidoglycan-binding domain-containing protein, partial [Bacteroidota bacterium]